MSLIEARAREERRAAIRALLVSPLIVGSRNPETFKSVSRHADRLAGWFDDTAGWRLAVDPSAGFARLFKNPPARAGRRVLKSRGRVPFDRRRYVLLSISLAALSEMAGQMTVRRLAELVQDAAGAEAEIDPFEPERFSERRAFVDALLWLADAGVLASRDGDAEAYVRSAEGDALYDVNDRLVAHLVGTPLAPSLAAGPGELGVETYPDTEEGRRMRARHEVTRTMLDEPVLYVGDLSDEARAWLDQTRSWLYQRLRDDCGFEIERRREGLSAVDPAGEVTDERFPDGKSTVRHAALLLAEQLSDPARRETGLLSEEIDALAALLVENYAKDCAWSRAYVDDPAGAARLAADAMDLLERFGLAERRDGRWRPRPAIARFRPTFESREADR